MPDTPTPTREEVVAKLREWTQWPDTENSRGNLVWHEEDRVAARAALASLAPDPWAEADAADYDEEALWHEDGGRQGRAARYRRAAQRARGVPVTEDGR